MTTLVIFAWMILFFAPVVWGQEKCGSPVWDVGDKWTYKDVAGQSWTNEVVDSQKNLYILKIGGIQDTHSGLPENLYAFDKRTLNLKYVIEQPGGRYRCTSQFREFFNFPISIGKNWTEVTNDVIGGIDYAFFNTFKIEGIEEVSTAAGTFNAYRVSCKFNICVLGKFYNTLNLFDGETGFGWYRFWYSPQAKTWIKRKSQTGQWWGDRASYWYKDAELVSYQLN